MSGEFDALYHSKHGAIQESMHVFIEAGLRHVDKNELRILEVGFGTGLNALLTYIESQAHQRKIEYTSIEAYPISIETAEKLNYPSLLEGDNLEETLLSFHKAPWSEPISYNDFTLIKEKVKVEDCHFDRQFDLVYYDAFSPMTQEELWTPEIFLHLAQFLSPGAVLVSYCCKGSFKRALIAAGFNIEKIPGPPGKREMIRATFRT